MLVMRMCKREKNVTSIRVDYLFRLSSIRSHKDHSAGNIFTTLYITHCNKIHDSFNVMSGKCEALFCVHFRIVPATASMVNISNNNNNIKVLYSTRIYQTRYSRR